MSQRVIGIDFDNTIVSYDSVFHRVCLEKGFISSDCPPRKAAIRQRFIDDGLEDAWTEMQGHVYGVRIAEAQPFPGVEDALKRLCDDGHRVVIISHRTKHPYRGPAYDLHAAAKAWLAITAIPHHDAFFELTIEEKLARIAEQKCSAFIDDLPAVLQHRAFPKATQGILFGEQHSDHPQSFADWNKGFAVATSAPR